MGEPVKIEDMARDLIRLSGLEPDVDIEIKYSGIRPGEKLYEELLTSEEGTNSTQYEKIMVARNGVTPPHFFEKLENLFTTAQNGNPEAIKTMICSIIPSYSGAKKEKVEEGS
jgi:FlaA1/EpsC-like NDP-sugar epimerase